MREFRIGETIVSIVDLWSILTTVSAITGIAFLLGCFDGFGPNFIFIFGFEDILLATIYSMIGILAFSLILYLFIVAFGELLNALIRRNRQWSELSWAVTAPAFLVMSGIVFWLAARLTNASKGDLNLATTMVVPTALGLGLFLGFCALRGHFEMGFARRSAACRWALATASSIFLLGVTPNNLGFAYMIYLWDGAEQLTSDEPVNVGTDDQKFGHIFCNEDTQVLWVGSRVTILRCGYNFVGRINSTGERFRLHHVIKIKQ